MSPLRQFITGECGRTGSMSTRSRRSRSAVCPWYRALTGPWYHDFHQGRKPKMSLLSDFSLGVPPAWSAILKPCELLLDQYLVPNNGHAQENGPPYFQVNRLGKVLGWHVDAERNRTAGDLDFEGVRIGIGTERADVLLRVCPL